ncbi:EpsG family protein [Ralstonia mannitolilytica]|uniref:EpsG family protein n=1 Tax=Ralstonia mannitolilytica TaxID=105219 RepID=UPI0015F086B6|nr:EpsG family protein [Ralstonia mannitolilytica]
MQLFLAIPLLVVKQARLPRALTALCTLPLLFALSQKGLVGTDTYTYVKIIEDINLGLPLGYGYEPGFVMLVRLILTVTDDPIAVINTISVASVAIIIFSILRSDNVRQDVIYSVVFSYIILDVGMNSIRFGAALSLFLLGASYKEQSRIRSWLLFSIAPFFQFTVVYLIFGVLCLDFMEGKRTRGNRVLLFFFGVLFFLAIIILFWENVREKVSIYFDGGFSSPGAASGLAPFIMSLILVFISFVEQKKRIAAIPFAVAAICFALAQYSYMFLRILQMNLVLLAMVVAATPVGMVKPARHGLVNFLVVVLFFLGCSFKIKNFLDEQAAGLSESPFIPYSTKTSL